MNETPLSVQGIVELASAYYGSALLFAAVESDIFTTIERMGNAVAATELATRVGGDSRAMGLLLDGLTAIGLLGKRDGRYANAPGAAAALVTGAPHDLTQAVRYNQDVYAAWGRLARFVATGKPVEAPEIHLGGDQTRTRRFVLAMHARALGIGRLVIPMLDLTGRRRLLDLAGGPGTYAALLAQAHPQLTCVTVDLPAISAVAAELVASMAGGERVICRAGDYHLDDHEPETYDAVTIFGALHQESPEQIAGILRRAHAALRPGGRIFILDMMTDATHTRPVFSALFALNMALTTEHGWVFSDEEIKAWLRETGFVEAETRFAPPPMPHWLVSARRP